MGLFLHQNREIMKKLNVEYCISDDSVNCYGYRLLTGGFRADLYKPRVGFLMHDRSKGVALRWEDLRTAQGCLYATPVVNDVRFPNLAKEIEEGFYSGASVGGIVALKWSDDEKDKLEGQTGPTVTEWYCREVSIVDVPGNYNALAKLYDATGNVLMDLSAQLVHEPDLTKKQDMDELNLTADELQLMDLSATSTREEVMARLRDLVDRAKKYDDLKAEYDALQAGRNKEKVDDIIAKALADKKMYPAMAEHLKKHYADMPEALQELVDTMPVQTVVVDTIDEGDVPAEYKGKSFRELYLSGDLVTIAEKYPKYYKRLKEDNNASI